MLVLISHFKLLHQVECLNLLETESAMKWGGDALVAMQEEHDFDWISNGKMYSFGGNFSVQPRAWVTKFRWTVHQYYTNLMTARLSSLPITHFPCMYGIPSWENIFSFGGEFFCPVESMRVTKFRWTVHQYHTNPLSPSLPITHFPYQVRAQSCFCLAEMSMNFLLAFE